MKLRQYCAYQERCHSEVRDKLREYGVYFNDADEVIAKLIEDDYLNEERFAKMFAGGKFRMKQWGKKKIEHELKQRQVSAYCIKKAMKEIGVDDYEDTLLRLIEQKRKALNGSNTLQARKKIMDFLLQKGYEYSMIASKLNK